MNQRTTDTARISPRTLLQAGAAFAGGAFLAGTYFGIWGAIAGSVTGFTLVLITGRNSAPKPAHASGPVRA